MTPLPSIYSDDEPISDPDIREVYLGDIARQSQHVLAHGGVLKFMFGDGSGPDGIQMFDLFGPPTGGEVRDCREGE